MSRPRLVTCSCCVAPASNVVEFPTGAAWLRCATHTPPSGAVVVAFEPLDLRVSTREVPRCAHCRRATPPADLLPRWFPATRDEPAHVDHDLAWCAACVAALDQEPDPDRDPDD